MNNSVSSSTSTAPVILELKNVTRRFGGLIAVNDVSMVVRTGTIHGLIGPNGAGKSTAFDLISGLTALSSGSVSFNGRDITRLPVDARVAAGICRTFQTSRLFEKMTALEVVMTGCHLHGSTGILGSMFSIGGKMRDEMQMAARARALLETVGLGDQTETPVVGMSYGKRRLVEIARALATGPRLLLLDEVASGLNPVETEAVGLLIRKLASDGLTIVVVEHDMRFVMGLCEQITVLNFGANIANGTPADIVSNQEVIEAYLGRPRMNAVPRRELRRQAASTAQPN
ncbi:ABC transporter ATP-binding protein [Lacisediminimonas sp.]|uniref:ABC transporter ATP-binding protein n=1 Tax=Lacisediminimonas sp. TaxID=3060582 RepID=UPI0027172514|nr:ABC transporter ATP-binding protein [Lacisediminimonas sp.]MDO8301195.1 ABC transporter ATP-binding protein [Lacisediminimonas sp.]